MDVTKFLNKLVVITLSTGVGIKGTPTFWSEEYVQIEYSENDNYTIIFKPFDNIVMVSVYTTTGHEDIEMSDEIDDRHIVEPDDSRPLHYETDPELRALSIAELHLEKKQAVHEMLKNHFNNRVARIPEGPAYDTPDFTK